MSTPPKFVIEPGYKFNALTVLHKDNSKKLWYICECNCGNIKSIEGRKIREGIVKTCGNCTVNKIQTGYKSGKLTAIHKDPDNKYNWICECGCGNIISVMASKLINKNNQKKSCGCAIHEYPIENYVGQKIHKLTIIKILGRRYNKRKTIYYSYICECGKSGTIDHPNVGIYKSCGCSRANQNNYKEIHGEYWDSIKRGAIKRKIEFNLTQEYIYNIYLKQNKRCNITNIEIGFSKEKNKTTASLDRIDNNKGYIEGNVQWLHKHVNMMKRTFPNSEIIDFFENVADNYIRKNHND